MGQTGQTVTQCPLARRLHVDLTGPGGNPRSQLWMQGSKPGPIPQAKGQRSLPGTPLHPSTSRSYRCSCAAMCRESMMSRTASAICLARTVCCSNLVFTADWEMHSWNRRGSEGGRGHQGPPVSGQALAFTARDRAGRGREVQTLRYQNQKTHLKSPLKILKLKHPHLKAFCKSAP